MILRYVPRARVSASLRRLGRVALTRRAAFRLMNDNYANKRINDYADKKLSGSREPACE